MLNKATLIGNVGKDPEIRTTQNGNKIASLTLATSETWKDKHSGERQEKTEWHRVVCFNDGITGVIEKYVHKGSKLYIEGKIKTRKWQDQSGAEKYSTEIVLEMFDAKLVLLTPRGEGGSPGGSSGGGYGGQDNTGHGYGGAPSGSGGGSSDLDDEIPF